ncbi:LytR C-terminal domain-containing protein [Glutamicibacter sp. MNS18]|uniref:LytR C-terminal domain-containing protein n=1 Tax=Glutamicibacter sp. MNS18 TaxID=2989817 RepID=UPI002235A3DE|nr:LytR C-terminal domain-containing protein [Glutamicibacter sp. MNS18]MCW4466499.1 LytR C-terminal domain-containing protein [Glutamicibacter sp. MNS18]
MTNYPRDEFDRVPEFNTRVGSHHANGWAQAAASEGKGGKFRWVAMAAVLVLLVGAVSYFFFGPNGQIQLLGSSPSEAVAVSESAESASPTPTVSPTPSSTIDDAEVLFGQLVGVYNGAGIAGIASQTQEVLLENDFVNSYTDDWVRMEQVSAVYFTAETYRTTAEKVAEVLNIDEVYQTSNIPNRITVVLGADDPLAAE